MSSPSLPQPAALASGIDLVPVSFASLDGWEGDDHFAAFDTFCRSAEQYLSSPYRSGLVGIDPASFANCAEHALTLHRQIEHSSSESKRHTAREFFENRFTPHRIEEQPPSPGFVTGYYEPELAASLQKTEEFTVPLYRRPDDLVDVDNHNRPDDMDPAFQFGRSLDGVISPYFDRGEIQRGALEGRGLEIAWLKDKTDAFFVHVQGSARLTFQDGQKMRIGFAAKNGYPYSSLGKIVCEASDIPASQMTADRLTTWMRAHPDTLDGLMARNRSYIFFKQLDHPAVEDIGPVGAAKVALTPGRSLAVDKQVHQYGLPVWVTASRDLLDEGSNFSRLMVAQDTGSAIVGAQRGDIFVGSGSEAGHIAGRIRDQAEFTFLVPVT